MEDREHPEREHPTFHLGFDQDGDGEVTDKEVFTTSGGLVTLALSILAGIAVPIILFFALINAITGGSYPT